MSDCRAENFWSATVSAWKLRATLMSTMLPEWMSGGSSMDGNSICRWSVRQDSEQHSLRQCCDAPRERLGGSGLGRCVWHSQGACLRSEARQRLRRLFQQSMIPASLRWYRYWWSLRSRVFADRSHEPAVAQMSSVIGQITAGASGRPELNTLNRSNTINRSNTLNTLNTLLTRLSLTERLPCEHRYIPKYVKTRTHP